MLQKQESYPINNGMCFQDSFKMGLMSPVCLQQSGFDRISIFDLSKKHQKIMILTMLFMLLSK